MAYTLAEAAAATGLSKSTIFRAMQETPARDGKRAKPARLSGVRSERDGSWLIEPAELHRIYPARQAKGEPVHDLLQASDGSWAVDDDPAAGARQETLQQRPMARHATAEVELLRELVAARDATIEVQRQTIEDLRVRLDRADDERRQAQALLTDQRPAPARGVWWWFTSRAAKGGG